MVLYYSFDVYLAGIMDVSLLKENFRKHFAEEPLVVRSPGRINLIGEHTDYNEGFVLPAAIDKAVYIAISKRAGDELHWISLDMNSRYSGSLRKIEKSGEHWPDYLLGVTDQLQKPGVTLTGFNVVLAGEVPIGAGLSSSAAVECATVFALNEIFKLGLDKLQMVKLSQKAENEFAGVKCGIMDQFASMFGKAGHVIQLDCRSLDYVYYPLELKGYKIVLFDTQVKHSLASTEYNIRREECERGVALLQKKYPHVKSLRDATMQMVNEQLKNAEGRIYDRCRFVVEEIERVRQACIDLQGGNIEAFGKKMFAAHAGLSRMYEVSCEELDFLADLAVEEPAVVGARMMGGGFGGCTINIISESALQAVIEKFSNAYRQKFAVDLKSYIVEIKDGTSVEQ
ncbi:MAG: galactokinase [Chitinophagaceae bacterium]|nr:galactokinase [Chitinophagaceae bacterium]